VRRSGRGPADSALVTFERGQGGTVRSVEVFVLAIMAAILVAIVVPSYITMRNRDNDSAARAQLRQAAEAAEAYRVEHGSYIGLSPAALGRLDVELETGYGVKSVAAKTYCLERTVGGRTWHLASPAGQLGRGGCP
jgi:Tfp pilus assembly protein PilE